MSNLLKAADASALQSFLAGISAELLEQERAASAFYNFDFDNEKPLEPDTSRAVRFQWTGVSPSPGEDKEPLKSTFNRISSLAEMSVAGTEVSIQEESESIRCNPLSSFAPVKKPLTKRKMRSKGVRKMRRVGQRRRTSVFLAGLLE